MLQRYDYFPKYTRIREIICPFVSVSQRATSPPKYLEAEIVLPALLELKSTF